MTISPDTDSNDSDSNTDDTDPNISEADNSASPSPAVSTHLNHPEHSDTTTEVNRVLIYGGCNENDRNVVIPVFVVIIIVLFLLLVASVITATYFYNKSKRLPIKDQT